MCQRLTLRYMSLPKGTASLASVSTPNLIAFWPSLYSLTPPSLVSGKFYDWKKFFIPGRGSVTQTGFFLS